MGTPCGQEVKIAQIELTLSHITSLLDRHEEREERMMVAMEAVAAQAEIIKANTDNISRHEKAIDQLFVLSREEIKGNTAIQFWRSSAGIYGLAIIAIGLIVDFTEHFKLLRTIIEFIRG